MNDSVVSVCMITYNHEPYIAQAIESIMMQETDFNYRLIIGEDSSKDATRSICELMVARYPDKIKLLSSDKNYGMMPNFLRTIRECTGRYIAICEGDDYWTDKNKLQKQFDFMEKNADVSVHYHYCTSLIEGKEVNYDQRHQKDFSFTFIDALYGKNGYTVSMFFRSDAFQIKALDIITANALIGDWPLELLLLCNKQKGFFLNQSMAVYREHLGGITKYRSFNKMIFIKDRIDICNKLMQFCSQKRVLRFFLGELYLHLSLYDKSHRYTHWFKGLRMILMNYHFQQPKEQIHELNMRSYFKLLLKRINKN